MTIKHTTIRTVTAMWTAGLIALAAAPGSARAASAVSEAFLANVAANTEFLAQSSALAATRAEKDGIRSFARADAPDEARLAATFGLMRGTLAIAWAQPGASADDMQTGRSVAVDKPVAANVAAKVIATKQAANGGTAMGADDLAKLDAAAAGRAFDDLYWQSQLDALSQLESDYRTYIASGDDPVLVATAKRELPGVMRRLEALAKI